jgi:hypothetical protein
MRSELEITVIGPAPNARGMIVMRRRRSQNVRYARVRGYRLEELIEIIA